jgi:hypothetical protein
MTPPTIHKVPGLPDVILTDNVRDEEDCAGDKPALCIMSDTGQYRIWGLQCIEIRALLAADQALAWMQHTFAPDGTLVTLAGWCTHLAWVELWRKAQDK